MQSAMLDEIATVPNPYPIVAEPRYPEIARLCEQARALAWSPATEIDWESLRSAEIAPEARAAGAEWWSLRAWMEHGAVPYGCERLRDAIFRHEPLEVKQHLSNFIAEELRHHEASARIAEALGGYQPEPRSDYFRGVIPRFHSESVERSIPFYGGLAVNTLFETLSAALLEARQRNAEQPAIKEACRLIMRDEGRHIAFGRVIMRRFFGELTADEKRTLGETFAAKLRGSLLNGVYAVVNLPPEERRRAACARARAADARLGATHPDEEVEIIQRSLAEIRAEAGAHGVPIPRLAEIER